MMPNKGDKHPCAMGKTESDHMMQHTPVRTIRFGAWRKMTHTWIQQCKTAYTGSTNINLYSLPTAVPGQNDAANDVDKPLLEHLIEKVADGVSCMQWGCHIPLRIASQSPRSFRPGSGSIIG